MPVGMTGNDPHARDKPGLLAIFAEHGADYDLSGAVTLFTWRKNRRPTGPDTYGVDLNRNWGHALSIPVPEELANDPGDTEEIPYPPGVSADWVYGELGIMVFGAENIRPTDFFRKLPESNTELVESQVKGYLYLLDVLSENPFEGD